ncbi:squalene--hopene cyclase [bacterium]|nr:squalene--hopene cyclase [bacterium]
MTDRTILDETLAAAQQRLLAERVSAGHWEGELASSALSTAVACTALATRDPVGHAERVRGGLRWLAAHQNDDGGWGDTTLSRTNISTTLLCWAALGAAVELAHGTEDSQQRVEAWLHKEVGSLEPEALSGAILRRYGKDKTFSVPILTACAIGGRLGETPWRYVPALPFELAACPQRLFKWVRLPVVSYAVPALVAIGQARHRHLPSRNPIARLLRRLTQGRTLRVARAMQPDSGGFLEAVPITSFVAMSLTSVGLGDHPIAANAERFIVKSQRADGSWPIDENLATWVTTLSVKALPSAALPEEERRAILDWLLAQQVGDVHAYTQAEPGGWAWTDLSGGVPDADDTAGALLALWHLRLEDERIAPAVQAGAAWLMGLQNRDGGIPTFCRGWGVLPFDRSAPDLTAHAFAAWSAWQDVLPDRVRRATGRALGFLRQAQRADGAWTPLWFGNEHEPAEENPVYGTAQVLAALSDVDDPMVARGAHWLLAAQNDDGGWGGAWGTPSSIEETAVALDALARVDPPAEAVRRGVAWLVECTERGTAFPAAPIGFYFARLWYYEKLYPLIFTVGALRQASEWRRRNRLVDDDVRSPAGADHKSGESDWMGP